MITQYIMRIAEVISSYKANLIAIGSWLMLSLAQMLEYISGMLPAILTLVSIVCGIALTIVHVLTIIKLRREARQSKDDN